MRISSLMMTLLLGACTISSTGEEPASVECMTGPDGEMVCTQTGEEEDQPGGDNEGEQPGDPDGTPTCSSEDCTIRCDEPGMNEDGSDSTAQHCVIECSNGLRCDQVCNGESCALYCTCPDGGDTEPDPGCEGGTMENCEPDPCEERPGTEGCQPEGDDCEMNPDSTECQQPGDTNECEGSTDPTCCSHPDQESHEEYCQDYPDSAECV